MLNTNRDKKKSLDHFPTLCKGDLSGGIVGAGRLNKLSRCHRCLQQRGSDEDVRS